MSLSRRALWFVAAALLAAAGCYEYDTTIEPTPIQYAVEAAGHGKAAKDGDIVRIRYKVNLPDGTTVLQDDDNAFEVGCGTVITGIDQAVVGMKIGEKRRVHCPPHLHWGRKGYGGKIPPNTDLTIHMQLLEVK
ncbi:MAG: FKBP-type peptidyl-prolyl cis-trans isomerase [Planctomycetota bacterium]|jgi:FKBP-type peptidyl-prolyl cis-trans isomerase